MNTYETVFIVRPDLPQEETDQVLEFVKNNIEQHGGKILKVEPWGKQTMAYDIENFKDGYYFLIQYEADENYNNELTLRYRYNESILRHVIVAIDEKKFKLNPKRDTSGPKRFGKKPGGVTRKSREEKAEAERAEAEKAEKSETTEAAEEVKAEAPAPEAPKAEEAAPAETAEAPAVEKEEETEK